MGNKKTERYRMPAAWRAYGASWGDDELLYLPLWRRGFTPHELGALFWQSQQARSLEREVKTLTSTVERLTEELQAAERRTWWYRRQLTIESRLGLALAGIDGRAAI